MKKIENGVILLLSIICYGVALLFTYEFIIIQDDYLMLIPIVIFIVLATVSLILLVFRVVKGKTEYKLVDNKIFVERKGILIIEIDSNKIDEVIKYMDSFKEKTYFIKFEYENKKYRINIDENEDFLKICDNKKIVEKVDYSHFIEFILGLFQGF